jgi:hypothetical protein
VCDRCVDHQKVCDVVQVTSSAESYAIDLLDGEYTKLIVEVSLLGVDHHGIFRQPLDLS